MVKYLAWYIHNYKLCKRGAYKVKVLEEIKKFKEKYPDKKPIILFDFLACLSFFTEKNDLEVICAGRQTECTRRAKKLCEKFKELGCELIFFMDGPLKDDKVKFWMNKVNMKYEKQKLIFEMIKNNTPLKDIHTNHILTSYNNNFIRVAREYGTFIISFANECDIEIGEYATNNHAVGVFTNDTDFLIMKGDWPIWSPKDFNFDDFTCTAWNKKALRVSLNLEINQMPIFATLAGNDRVDYDIVQPFLNEIKNERGFSKLAEYVRREFPKGFLSREEFDKIIRKLYSYHEKKENSLIESEEDLRKRVSRSLNFYNYKRISTYEVRPEWLKKHINDVSSTFLYGLIKESPILIRQNYIDLSNSDVAPFSELVLPIIKRSFGIALYDKREKEITRRIYCKPNHEEPFQEEFISPIYPTTFEVPFVIDLVGYGKNIIKEEKKFELLSWIVSSGKKKIKISDLTEICNSIYFIPAIILNYLVKNRQITREEADIMLLVIHESSTASDEKMMNLSPPEKIQQRPFWIAFVYVQILYYFMNAVILCGLYKYVGKDYFDGFIFHKMYPKYLSMEEDKRQILLEPIEKYRLYTK